MNATTAKRLLALQYRTLANQQATNAKPEFIALTQRIIARLERVVGQAN